MSAAETRVVPVEPTAEMVEAGNEAWDGSPPGACHTIACWHAMLARAPSPAPDRGAEAVAMRAMLEETLAWINELPVPTCGAAAQGMRIHDVLHNRPFRHPGLGAAIIAEPGR